MLPDDCWASDLPSVAAWWAAWLPVPTLPSALQGTPRQPPSVLVPLHSCTFAPSASRPRPAPSRPLQDILAPLLHVNELRKHGVTLHMLLDAERQPIPDVPAIYFVQARGRRGGFCLGPSSRLPLWCISVAANSV